MLSPHCSNIGIAPGEIGSGRVFGVRQTRQQQWWPSGREMYGLVPLENDRLMRR